MISVPFGVRLLCVLVCVHVAMRACVGASAKSPDLTSEKVYIPLWIHVTKSLLCHRDIACEQNVSLCELLCYV